jgi:hypothetical protein
VIPDRTERLAAARADGDLPAELSGRVLKQVHGLLGPPFDRLIEIMVDIPDDSIQTFPASSPYIGRLGFGHKDRLRRIQNGSPLYTFPLACALGFLLAPVRRQSGRDFTGGRESREVSLCANRFYYVTIV